MNIGEKIRYLRTSQNLTQEDLAIAAGTTKQTIHKYETGIITNIPASKVKALADKLATTPAYLMGWQDEDDTRTSAQILADSIKNRKAKLVAHGGDGVKYIDHISREEYESFFPESAKKCTLSNGIETTEITKEEFAKIQAFLKMLRE